MTGNNDRSICVMYAQRRSVRLVNQSGSLDLLDLRYLVLFLYKQDAEHRIASLVEGGKDKFIVHAQLQSARRKKTYSMRQSGV
jgi:hypothetical protein